MKLTRTLDPHCFYVDGKEVHGVNRIIQAAGMGTDYSAVHPDILEKARIRGIAVDAACDYLDDGDLDWSTVHKPWVNYVKAWEAAKPEWGLVVGRTQAWVYHPDYHYVGIIDVVARAHGVLVDIDRKTSKSIHKNPFGLQTAAYTMPGILMADADGELFERTRAEQRWIVQLTAKGIPIRHVCDDPLDFDDFVACINVSRGEATALDTRALATRLARYNGKD